jgi:hypothetical protein
MSGPAITICEGDFHIDNCKIYYLTDTKRYQGTFCDGKIIGSPFQKWSCNEERFGLIADFFIELLEPLSDTCYHMIIEGYAMGAKGLVFHIGENTGILKYKLFKKDIQFTSIAPTRVKKLATGKGNAKKDQMYECFVKETGIDLRKALCYTKTDISSPIGDIVDSYYICKALT